MYTAAAGMAAQQRRLDAASTDLANLNTTGYKHTRVAFRDLVYTGSGPGGAQGTQLGSGAAATYIGRSTVQGSLQNTGRTLDVAVNGSGYIQVKLADGRVGLTRDGNLKVDAQGRLAKQTGELVHPPVQLTAGATEGHIAIGPRGEVTVGDRRIGTLTLVDVPAPGGLQGGPNNTFLASTASGAIRAAAPTTELTQGTLEASNVDAAEAMVGMIEAQRAFELASKAVQSQDQAWQIANEVKR